MASPRSLTLAFIDQRPVAAGRALTAMEPEDAGAFLQDIPVPYATRLLDHMGAWAACSIATRMSVDSSAAALRGLHYESAAAILRLMAPSTRQGILTRLPTKVQRDFRMTLAFPADTVGAHMTTAILTQRLDHNVADARDQLQRAKMADEVCVIILDEAHQLAGMVRPVTLLRASGKTLLSDVMEADVEALSGRARISSVAESESWDRFTSLPVLSRRKHVIGALGRATLRRALSDAEPLGERPARSLPISLADALFGAVAGLTRLLASVPTPPRDGSGPGANS